MKYFYVTAKVVGGEKEYGIETFDNKSGKRRCFENLTVDLAKAERLAETINRSHVSEIHIDEIIEDFLE